MPNWCNNELIVIGDKKLVENFCNTQFSIDENTKQEVLDFSKLIPEPTFDNPEDEYKFNNETSGWYNWRINNWGVKWNASNNYINKCNESDEISKVTISFDTPWSPPNAWFEKLCEKYPTLDMELLYHECGMNYRGFTSNINGSAQDNCWDMTKEDYEELGWENDEQDTWEEEEDKPQIVAHDMDKETK